MSSFWFCVRPRLSSTRCYRRMRIRAIAETRFSSSTSLGGFVGSCLEDERAQRERGEEEEGPLSLSLSTWTTRTKRTRALHAPPPSHTPPAPHRDSPLRASSSYKHHTHPSAKETRTTTSLLSLSSPLPQTRAPASLRGIQPSSALITSRAHTGSTRVSAPTPSRGIGFRLQKGGGETERGRESGCVLPPCPSLFLSRALPPAPHPPSTPISAGHTPKLRPSLPPGARAHPSRAQRGARARVSSQGSPSQAEQEEPQSLPIARIATTSTTHPPKRSWRP
jgi:hypothetical protein